MKKNIPLVIPEVNPQFLDMIEFQQKENNWDGFIVTNPNCSTIALTLTLKPIIDNFNIKSVRVSTMQAVSGMLDALEIAKELGEAGDLVLLSPGGTSYDAYKDFEERGNEFRAWVRSQISNS